jgi:hypothetical protein
VSEAQHINDVEGAADENNGEKQKERGHSVRTARNAPKHDDVHEDAKSSMLLQQTLCLLSLHHDYEVMMFAG